MLRLRPNYSFHFCLQRPKREPIAMPIHTLTTHLPAHDLAQKRVNLPVGTPLASAYVEPAVQEVVRGAHATLAPTHPSLRPPKLLFRRLSDREVGGPPSPPSSLAAGAGGPAAGAALRAFILAVADAPTEVEAPNFCRRRLGEMLALRLGALGADENLDEAAQQRQLQAFMMNSERATTARQSLAVALMEELTPHQAEPALVTALLTELVLSDLAAQWSVAQLLANRYRESDAGAALAPLDAQMVLVQLGRRRGATSGQG